MLKRIFVLSGVLTLIFLVLFVIRQAALSTGIVQTQTDLAADLVSDFLSSPGALLDLARFIFFVVLLHGLFALFVGLASFSMLSARAEAKRWVSVTVLVFFAYLLTALVWVSLYFPLTMAGFLKFSPLSSHTVAMALTVLLSVLSLVGFFRCLKHRKLMVSGVSLVAILLMAITFAGSYFSLPVTAASNEANDSAKPNIIVIGIDALRPDHLGVNGYGYELTPNIDKFISESLYFEQSFTPIARTYTAWFSLLSGKPPKTTGIRYNLQKFEKSQLTDTDLQAVLAREGYYTIYGMDERRFNNIDERYGFHEDVGPSIGAADFLLFHASELPLVALVSNTYLGKWFFPLIYANRGIHGTYMPETFNREVFSSVDSAPDQPLFLALHLTLPHWPYLYREFEPLERLPFDPDSKFHYAYQLMLNEVDSQFSAIMSGLEDRGLLENSLVFLISDHGEGFMLESDALAPGNPEIEFPTQAHGHGTNVLDEDQYHVVLAVQDRRGASTQRGSRSGEVVSLLDIAPTITQRLGIDSSGFGYEGTSLFDVAQCRDCGERVVFIESSVATNAMFEEDLDVMQVMAEGIGYYTVDSDGLAIVREEVKELLAMKQRAVVSKGHIVAHFPGLEKDFVVVDRNASKWWPSSLYGGDSPAEVVSLMRRLCGYFRGDVAFDDNQLCQGAQ